MNLFETLLQDLRYGARTLLRNPSFTIVSILALALGIGVNVAVFTAYKAFIARPLDARDPDTLVNLSLRLQSGATNARFSYPDYEAYRDGLRSFSGVIAFSIEKLTLTDAGGAVARRSAQNGSLIGRLGLLTPSASNREIASAFVVSENYFSVLGVEPARGRAFDAMSASELVTSPSVLISENYWQRRFAGDPAVLGKSIRLNGALFTIVGITPLNFTGTSIAVPNFWLPLSLYPLIHPHTTRLRDREDLCCRVFGRLAPGMSMSEAQAETTVLASRLGALHEPNSELRKDRERGDLAGLAAAGDQRQPESDHRVDHGRGRTGSGHRVRQRRWSPVGAWRRPPAGARHAARARRERIASGSPVDDRKRPGRRAGGLACATGHVGDAARGGDQSWPNNSQSSSHSFSM